MFTQQQTCSCTGGRQALCPFHGALRLAIGIRQARRWSSDTFLCSGAAIPPSKRQVARLAQVVGFCLHNDASEDWMLSQIEDWAEHAFRVAGAQLLARSMVPLPTIQMLGRWGSMAVMRYVQEAVMNQPAVTAATVASYLSGAPSVRSTDTLRDQVRKLVAECIEGRGIFVHNVKSRLAHKPCAGEDAVPSDEWLSACGKWRYGTSSPSCPQFLVKTQHPSPQDAGLDAKVSQLLVDHGITNSGTFFYTFQGVKLSTGTAVKLDDVQYMVALSVVAHMVDEIRVAKAKREGVLQSAGTTPTAAAAVSTAATKAPKVLPEGYWAEFLAEFQSEKIGGIARQFPTHLLSGADEILARLVHERVTRSHTPLKLGEIVAHRQFTASGQINPFRIKEEPGSRMLLRDDGLFDRAPRHITHSGTHSCVNFTCAANVAEALARYLLPDSKGKGAKGEQKGKFKTVQSESEGNPRKRP
ncbi:unnamed protein product, partial [Symbiodinium necroappetens]